MKFHRILFLFFFLHSLSVEAQVPSYVDTNGLVGWWPFDGNANDISGNGNNGLVYGSTLTTDRNLNTNSAYSFNGSSYISVANSALLSSLISEGTISLWTVSNFGGGSPICKSGSSLLGDFRIQHSTSNVSFIINGKDYSINGIFPAGQWINIVMTYKNSTAKLYINGNLIGSLATPSNTYTIDRINSLDFGRDPWGSMEYHNGKIDDIGIWNKALDSNKVKLLYNATPCNLSYQLPQDTITSSSQDSVLLDAGVGFITYTWSNGDSTQTTYAKSTGIYSVQVTDTNGCSASDSVFVSIINDSILQNDTTICKGDSVLLSISQPIGQALTVCNGNNLPSNLQTGLVGYWPFCGNANDESGNGYGGVVNGAVLSTDRFGLINAAYSFDGIDDNIEVQNYQDTLNALSISLWFNQTISGILLDFGNETLGGSNTFANRFNINDYGSIGNLMFSFDYTYGQIPLTNYSSLGWNHTVVTWNGSTMNLYVNNLLIGTQTSSISEIRIFLSDIKRFGSRYQPLGSNQVNFGGIIDDIGIWNRALNTSEVQQLYLGNYSSSYSWSTGDTTSTISVSPDSTTTYYVTISNGIHSCLDSVTVTVNNPQFQFAQDTITSCTQDSVLLDAGAGFASYNWSNGDSTQLTYAKATGMYSVQVTDSNGCSAEDSVFVSIIKDSILQNDTIICEGDSVSLSVGIPQPTNLLIDSITIRMDSVWDYSFTSLDTTRNYILKVNGLWANCCGHLNYDVAFGGITWSSISPVIWNSSAIYFHMDGLPFPRPTPDVYSTSHQYDYPLSPSKDSIEISFYDNPTTDNIGALRFRLFQLIDPSSLTHQWSNGDTASSISVSPDSTTTYYVTISNGIHSCVDSVTVTVNNPQFQFAQDSVSGCDTVIVNTGSGWSSYSWSSGDTTQSVSFTTTGMKVLTVTDSIGCTATDSVYVTVNTYVTTTIADTSCDQYTWSQTGVTYTMTDTYSDTIPTAFGCDSIINLNLVIYNLDTVRIPVVSCDSFTWPQTGLTYYTSGVYQDSLVNNQGCDSILLLDLTITQTTSSIISVAACDSFTWLLNGMTYNSSGVYSDTITTSQGCDSIVSLNLTINTLSYQLPQDTFTSCGQDSVLIDAGVGFASYNWSNGDSSQTTYAKATGMYAVQVTDSNGCSAEDSVFVSIIKDSKLQNDTTICKGDSVSLSVFQLQPQALTICNSNNLPSNLQTGLVGYWPFCGNANDESGNGNNGTVNGVTLTLDKFGNLNSAYNFSGNAQTIELPNTLIPGGQNNSFTIQTRVKFDNINNSPNLWGKTLFWGEVNFSVSSTGEVTLKWANSLTGNKYSVIKSNPGIIQPNIWYDLVVSFQNNQAIIFVNGIAITTNYLWIAQGGSVLSTSRVENSCNFNQDLNSSKFGARITGGILGNYLDGSLDEFTVWNRTLSNTEISQLYSLYFPALSSNNFTNSYQWSTGDTTSAISVSPDSTTKYYVTISNGIHSCVDSVTVTVNNPQFQFAQDSVTGCDTVTVNAGAGWSTYTWSSGDTTQSVSFTTTGMKVLTVTDSIGCAATDSIYVTVNTFVTSTITDTSCDQYTWRQTGITYGSSGTYRDTVPTVFGCDSILELVLTITNSTFSSDTVVACESYLWTQTGATYYTTSIYFDTMVNAVGCDSVLALDLTVHYSTSFIINQTACDSFSWAQTGLTYFVSGTYQDTLLNARGCDSVVYLNLLVYPTITPIIGNVQNMCENDPIVSFTASPIGGVWSGPGISATGSFDPTLAGVGVHTIVYTAAGQCANSDTVLIEVYDIPFINGLIKDDECNEGIGSIKTTVTGGATPYTYLWNDRVNTKDNLGLTEGTYTLTVTDDNSCKGDYVGSLLNLQDDSCDDTYLFVPNIFSPDGNGVNDILFVDGKNIQQVQLMIYNRWGNLVFQSNSLAEGWDGNFKGKPVNQGVFVYIVTGRFKDGKDFDQKGTITLIRKK